MLNHLRSYLEGYLQGGHTLQGVEEWLLGSLQQILDSGNQKLIRLANQVDADLMEYNDEVIGESELRERFAKHLVDASKDEEIRIEASSETDVIFKQMDDSGQAVTVHFHHVVA